MILERRKQKIRDIINTNLTYLRLQEDLWTIEKEMGENQPVQAEESQSWVKKMLFRLSAELENQMRRKSTEALTAERKLALEQLAEFERNHKPKELALSKDAEKLKKYITKKLFKKDKYGMERMRFAITFMMDGGNAVYQRPQESLRIVSAILFDDPQCMARLSEEFHGNFRAIQEKFGSDLERGIMLGVNLMSLLPPSFPRTIITAGVSGAWALIRYGSQQRRLQDALCHLSQNEAHALFAMELTVIEESKGYLPDKEWRELLDRYLNEVSRLRADAEYEWLVEQMDAPLCKEKIEVCDLCIERLAKLLGV